MQGPVVSVSWNAAGSYVGGSFCTLCLEYIVRATSHPCAAHTFQCGGDFQGRLERKVLSLMGQIKSSRLGITTNDREAEGRGLT